MDCTRIVVPCRQNDTWAIVPRTVTRSPGWKRPVVGVNVYKRPLSARIEGHSTPSRVKVPWSVTCPGCGGGNGPGNGADGGRRAPGRGTSSDADTQPVRPR